MFEHILGPFLVLFCLLGLISIPLSAFEQQHVSIEDDLLTEEEKQNRQAFAALDWQGAGTYKLPHSNSTLSIPEGYLLLIGEEAQKLREFIGESYDEDEEAIVFSDDFDNTIHFENYKDGYISLDDWKNLNPKKMLETISDNTEKSNKNRKKSDDLHVIGWMQEPILDRNINTVYWAIEAENGEKERIVNSVALKLGREGFEKVIWVADKNSYVPFGGELDVMLRAHSFDPGFGYNDHTTGDKIASYGIASLVAATVGGKIVKSGGLVLLFKKISGFICVAIAAILYKFRKIFRRKQKDN